MIPVFPADLPQSPRRGNWTGGPRDERVSFAPDRGPAIERPGTTAASDIYQATFGRLTNAELAIWRDFTLNTLARGVLPFAWRDPVLEDVALWSIVKSGEQLYSITALGAGRSDVSVSLMRRPGPVWWAPYAAEGRLRLPYAVADYTGSVFGVDLARTAAAGVAAVSGTYDVFTTRPGLSTLVEYGATLTAGDIPATAPVGVSKILAFPVLA